MLPVRFDEISSDDILKLITDKAAERKTLEYKQKLNIASGDDRAEFLSDISSFANASGGDIIFGISDERDGNGNATGVPAEITPLVIDSIGERLRTWKTDRISKAIAGEGPVPMEGSQILFHFVSATTLTNGEQSLPRIFDTQKLTFHYKLLYMSVHALTGSFTLDVYGGQPEWGRNLEAAQLVGAELEKAVNEVVAKLENERNAEVVGSLLAIQEKRLGSVIS